MVRSLLSSALAAGLGLLAAPHAGAVVVFQTHSSKLSAEAADTKARQEVEAEDLRFWDAEWRSMEADLVSLQSLATEAPSKTQPAKKHEHEKSTLAGLKLNLEPKTPADLVPALAMLKGLYEDGKERIAKLNAREQENKHKFEEKQTLHQKRLDEIEARFKNHSLSLEFRTNETRDENRLWSYWERVRDRQHKQFHTSLKIQHGTLEKVKAMIDMYEKTISGKADKKQVEKQLAKVGGGALPEVVFLQDMRSVRRDVAEYTVQALTLIQSERNGAMQQSKMLRLERERVALLQRRARLLHELPSKV